MLLAEVVIFRAQPHLPGRRRVSYNAVVHERVKIVQLAGFSVSV
jgi:hypothetical protein